MCLLVLTEDTAWGSMYSLNCITPLEFTHKSNYLALHNFELVYVTNAETENYMF